MSKQSTLFNFLKKTPKQDSKKESKGIKIRGFDLKLFDLVWTKLEGYPWWPAIVCNHPSGKYFVRKKEIHVQFFDDPPTRGWVKDSFIKKYGPPSDSGVPTYNDPEWLRAKEDADGVQLLSHDERAKIIVEMKATDDEEEESMEEESFDGGSDESKENIDTNAPGTSSKKRCMKEESPDKRKNKKRKIVFGSDSEASEDEYKPGKDSSSEEDSLSSGVDEITLEESDSHDEPSPSPIKRKLPQANLLSQKRSLSKAIFSPSTAKDDSFNTSLSESTKSKLSLFAAKEGTPSDGTSSNDSNWPHTKLRWLQPDFIKDKNGNRPSHPEYNPRTLYISMEFLNKQTPAMRQWWELKSDNYDTVLFFKMGKFYELFHMDAVLSVQELGLLMMKGENAHTGFPEISFGRYSSIIIEKGYKVSRIEQVETPEMMDKRCKSMSHTTKFDKVVKRELCQITSKATRLPSVMDGEAAESEHFYLLALTEKGEEGNGNERQFGASFIDTTIGMFYVGQFKDDRHISRLRTLLSHHPPAQIIYPKGQLSAQSFQLLKSFVPVNLHEILAPEKEFWSADKTFSYLRENDYFKEDSKFKWPETFKELSEEEESCGLIPNKKYELGISALGGLIFYLKHCQLEDDLLTRRLFDVYHPPDLSAVTSQVTSKSPSLKKHMILDGTALQNLEVFENSLEGTEGTLYEVLNNCHTRFGGRLLYNWICSPLCSISSINSRLDAIEDLKDNQDIVSKIEPLLKKLPDLQRLLAKIHSHGLKRSSSHPDSRAILFEQQIYSQRKVEDFISALKGFETALEIIDLFTDISSSLKSSLLRNIVSFEDRGGKFPSLKSSLKFFANAFNQKEAQKLGKIIPSAGVDSEYDEAISKIKEIEQELNSYLSEQTNVFGVKVNYFGSDKRRFQIEVPEHAAKKAGKDYEFVSQKKGFKRFSTSKTKKCLGEIMVAEEMKENALKDIARRIFSQFDNRINEWTTAVECLSVLDVLLSLTNYSQKIETCRPTFQSTTDGKPIIDIVDGRHPCNIKVLSDNYIPNDVRMNTDGEDSHAPLVLITGPNMGGKSTLMRQTALICLLAQLGCFVPASKCCLTPVDRIFTRVGARDRMFHGESTFYVELAETASIIQHATKYSLVLIDELGRGTATYDGTAIAASVVDRLISIGCRTLFSTHYHSLIDDFSDQKGISLGHMACVVEEECSDDPSQESIVFLYKFTGGACPKSYGFNAARLADLSNDIIKFASRKATQFENQNIKKKIFSSLFHSESLEYLKQKHLVIKLREIS